MFTSENYFFIAAIVAAYTSCAIDVCVPCPCTFKGSLQWKNDLRLYFTLVLVMKIDMCDLMIFPLV